MTIWSVAPSKIAAVSSSVRFFVSMTSVVRRQSQPHYKTGEEGERTEVEEDAFEHEPDAVHDIVLPVYVGCEGEKNEVS